MSEKSVKSFVSVLKLASSVENKSFAEIVKIANEHGYEFDEEEAYKIMRKMFNSEDKHLLPEWLNVRLQDMKITAGWPD